MHLDDGELMIKLVNGVPEKLAEMDDQSNCHAMINLIVKMLRGNIMHNV
jgi:hypothetical protein